ncbi:MAG: hypothetical protein AAGJ18_22815, partial [Bacteroidota bacterium]
MKQLPDLLDNFEQVVAKSIERTWEAKNLPINLETMANETADLSQALVAVGDFCYQQLTKEEVELSEKDKFDYNWITFDWAILAKEFLILWRDILFQQQKGRIVKIDRLTTVAALRALNTQSQETLDKVLYDFKGDVERGLNITTAKKTKKIGTWSLQQNPWPVYREQLLAMSEQCLRMQKDYRVLLNVADNFNEIEDKVLETEAFCQSEIKSAQRIAAETIAEVENNSEPKLNKIVKRLEELEAGISLPNHFNWFTSALEHRINSITTNLDVPVGTNHGQVILKDIPFKRSSKQWLDAEILPLLYEVWELTENTHNGLKMALINIKNRAKLLYSEEREGRKVEINQATICQPLYVFQKNAEQAAGNLATLKAEIKERLLYDFKVSAIYDAHKEFLPVPLQAATLNEFRKGQNKVQNRIAKWFNQQWSAVQDFRDNVEKEGTLSDSERIVRLIKSRTGADNNSNYSSIFLTKGFIGESFAVGRKKELEHAKSLIDNWKAGFRGAAVITGERFSGKTILGELIASQFFDNNTIRLSPNTLIKLNGRRMMTGFNLAPALDFIVKYADNKPPLIWVDDIELWWDKELPLSQNVRTLRKFIDGHASRLFFLVSMSNWLKAHLDLFHETSRVFQSELNVDKMTLQEIQEAVMIRHGATHKKLIGEDDTALSSNQFYKVINKIYRATGGNIGEVLNRWSSSMVKVDQDHVFF